MYPRIRIKELKPINIDGGILVDGFPSVGFTEAIATESLIHTTKFDLAGIIDSDGFPPVSLIKDGKPNYPTRIFVNENYKVAIFSSYLTISEPMHRTVARTMLSWARKHNISLILSGVAVKSQGDSEKILAASSTDEARKKITDAGLTVLTHGTIPGIPGLLLNEGMLNQQDVIVILFTSAGTGPDFKASAQLCLAMSKLIPGISCDIALLQSEAEKAEKSIKEAEEETKDLKGSIYG